MEAYLIEDNSANEFIVNDKTKAILINGIICVHSCDFKRYRKQLMEYFHTNQFKIL